MYLGYKKSRFALVAVMIFTLCIIGAVWVKDRELERYIPILATVLLLAIGALTARLIANLVASAATTDLLGILHMELDPERFLAKFSSVPGRIPVKDRDHIIASFYLSDGYAAAGRFAEAEKALVCPGEDRKNDYALLGTYQSALARIQIAGNDLDGAAETLSALDRLAVSSPSKELTKHLRANHTIYAARLAVKSKTPVDPAALEAELEKAQYKIRRLEILQILAENDLLRGQEALAKSRLQQLIEEGGQTCYRTDAEKVLVTLT